MLFRNQTIIGTDKTVINPLCAVRIIIPAFKDKTFSCSRYRAFGDTANCLKKLRLRYKCSAVCRAYNFIFNGMVKLGQNSLQIYCLSTAMLSSWLHVGFPYIVDLFGKNIFTQNMLVYNFVFTFVLSIVYSVGLYWLIKLFDKLKISKILFGK